MEKKNTKIDINNIHKLNLSETSTNPVIDAVKNPKYVKNEINLNEDSNVLLFVLCLFLPSTIFGN